MICYPSQGQTRSVNLRLKLSLQRKSSHPIKSPLSKVASAVWAIMIIKVVRLKGENLTTVTRPVKLKRACKAKEREAQGTRPPVNCMDSDDGDSDDYLGSLEVHNMDNKDRVIWVSPEVQGRVIKMELDTGSAVSVLPYKQYKERFGHVKLAKSDITLKTYTGEKITPMGEMKCNVKFKGQEKELTLQVVETPGPALFGRDWLSKIQLDWDEIKALRLSKTPKGGMQHKGDQLLQKYESVFSEGVGKLKGHKADLKVEENCQPSFHKPRQVPHALRPKGEAELTRLEKDGILSKVEYSEWATPIVPVVKCNGSVRICGDFKVSLSIQYFVRNSILYRA